MKKSALLKTNIFICVIITLGFIVTSLISYHSNQGLFVKETENISDLTSEGICHKIDSIFTRPISVSLTMANDWLLKDFLSREVYRKDDKDFVSTMRDYLLAYKEKYNYDSVFLVSAKTNRYYNFNGVDRTLTRDNPENVWYFSDLASGSEFSLNIDNDEVSTANNDITVFINCKIKGETGETAGIVGVGFRVDHIQAIFKEYEDRYAVRAYLVDENGDIQISTEQTGYSRTNLFSESAYEDMKEQILGNQEERNTCWYSRQGRSGYLVSEYIPNLGWRLILDNDTTAVMNQIRYQFYAAILIILLVIVCVLLVITNIIKKYNRELVRLTLEEEKKHRSVFQTETEKIYENIYELDITHNRAASEATEEYFKSLGVPEDTPFDKALSIIADKQIKPEFQEGYIRMFSPQSVLDAYENGVESLQYDFQLSNDGGITYYWMRITARIFYWDEDQSVRMLVYRQNVNAQKSHEKALVEKMERDSLTDLYNKAATQRYIHHFLQTSPGRMYAFFIIDIDNFKEVNDRFGHAFGDKVISEFAHILREQFGREDVVGRIGGDEFAAFLPVTGREEATLKAEELLMNLRHEIECDKGQCRISASIGVAIAPEAGTDFEPLYRNADKALYMSKDKGRNTYTFFSPGQI